MAGSRRNLVQQFWHPFRDQRVTIGLKQGVLRATRQAIVKGWDGQCHKRSLKIKICLAAR
jgi:hypothetical protein